MEYQKIMFLYTKIYLYDLIWKWSPIPNNAYLDVDTLPIRIGMGMGMGMGIGIGMRIELWCSVRFVWNNHLKDRC